MRSLTMLFHSRCDGRLNEIKSQRSSDGFIGGISQDLI